MIVEERRQIANKVEDTVHAFAYSNELPIDLLAIFPDRNSEDCFNMKMRTVLPTPYNQEIDRIAIRALSDIDKKFVLNIG